MFCDEIEHHTLAFLWLKGNKSAVFELYWWIIFLEIEMSRLTHIIIFVASILAMTTSAFAVTVNALPGELRQAVTAVTDPAIETELTVTGEINAADFDFLREMTALKSLNLGGASIVAYEGRKTEIGLTYSAANCLPECALLSGNFTELILPSGVTTISAGALGGSNIESLVIPSTVTKIEDGAFSNMPTLRELTIPSSVKTLGEMLFKDSPNLTNVELLADVEKLPSSTFCNCRRLTEVALSTSITSIGDMAFAGCESLTSIELPTSIKSIGEMAFAQSGLTTIHLDSKQLDRIGAWAFAGCTSLNSVTLSGQPINFGVGVFFNNPTLLLSLGDLAGTTTALPDYFLYGASAVSSDGFENTEISAVGDYALAGMTASKVVLPASLTSLGDNAMERWANLSEINAKEVISLPELGESVWAETEQSTIILLVPEELMDAYKDAPQWQDFDIRTTTSFNQEITATASASNLRGYFDGMALMLEADSNILSAQLYDVSGRCITIANNPDGNRMTIDTAPFDAQVFIVRILFSDGSISILKLFR